MLVLASASPRRQAILRAAGIPFVVRPAHLAEHVLEGESAQDHVRRLAEAKARTARHESETVLGADTVVTIDGLILGKPRDQQDAARMLGLLSSRWHYVVSGICLLTPNSCHTAVEETRVRFLELTEEEIAAYVATGEPLDKAGAYAIQGGASKFVERIEGCYFNVVGLPIARVYNLLRSRSS